MDDRLKELLQEEQELQFTKFNEEVAWKLGSQLVKKAHSRNLPVTVDITRGTHQLFHASLRGTSPDNDEWVKRKIRTVYRFGHSSFYIGQLLKNKGKNIEQAYLVSETEYAPHGGCFPIIVKDTGIVGTITVSGLPQEEDHKLVVETLRSYLTQEK
ncbi:MAG: heme-degrading domain-containing protein [Chloroflexota bacterium]